jgi:hypothetical protein
LCLCLSRVFIPLDVLRFKEGLRVWRHYCIKVGNFWLPISTVCLSCSWLLRLESAL